MGRQIIKQPNGLLCLWSSVVDSFILEDVSKEELIDFLTEEAKENITRDVEKVLKQVNEGKNPYYQFTLTYEEAKEIQGY